MKIHKFSKNKVGKQKRRIGGAVCRLKSRRSTRRELPPSQHGMNSAIIIQGFAANVTETGIEVGAVVVVTDPVKVLSKYY